MQEYPGVGRLASVDPSRQRDPLTRAVQLLTVMVDEGQPGYGVRQLGGMLDISASTAHRLLTQLEKLGMVARLPDGTYGLGMEFQRLAWAATARFPLRETAGGVLRDLADRCGESAFLGVYDDQRHRMMFAACVESVHPLRYVMELNTWLPVHSGASGLAILSFLPERTRSEIVHAQLEAPTERTITDGARLQEAMERVREQGYAVSRGQRIVGAVGLAAPVFGPSGAVVGDLGVTVPESRFDASAEPGLAALVMRSAEALTERIGGHVRGR